MKPLGLFFAISSSSGDRAGVDDDYEWHVRHIASQHAVHAAARRSLAWSITGRVGALARLLRSRSEVPTARRI